MREFRDGLMPSPIGHKDVQNVKEVVEMKRFIKKSMTEDVKLLASQFGREEKLGDGLICQVTTGNSVGEPVRGGQTSKVMKYVVGEKPFDIHKVLPIDEESLIKNIVNAGQIDLEFRKNDVEIMGPRTDVQFPAKVDDTPITCGGGNVQNYDLDVNAKCEENDDMDAEAEKTDEELDAIIQQWTKRADTLLQAAATASPSLMVPSVCSSSSAL